MTKHYLNLKGVNLRFWNETVRPTILRLKNNKCEICGSKKFLDIHHNSYEKQNINTLQVLCRKCHRGTQK